MNEQEKKRQKIFGLLNALFTVYKAKKICLQKERFFFWKKGSGGLNKKWEEGFLTAFTTVIKKDPKMSLRKAS